MKEPKQIENDFSHIPVMLDECLQGLNIKPSGVYVDCTLGGAGHSLEIVKKLKSGKLIAIDKDEEALTFSKNKLDKYTKKITFVKSDFKNFKNILNQLNISSVDGILIDLGVSSHQIDSAYRGFSYMQDGKLDMRMDLTAKLSAYDIVNTYSEKDLAKIIFHYGDEKFSRQIAKHITEFRKIKPIETTFELVDIIENSIPRKFKTKGHVAKKTFQAIRIEVNSELNNLDIALTDMINSLAPKGRLVVITFHSSEDRIVKNVFRDFSKDVIEDEFVPDELIKYKKATIKLINKKPLTATDEELKVNSRSSSAKVRIIEKL